MVRVVREADVAERHRAGRAAQRPGVGAFGHVGALVEQRENALGAREVRLKPRRLPADRLQRIVELSEVAQHHQELAEREHPRADVAHEVGWMPDRAAAVRAALREANDGCAPEGPVESVIAIDGLPPQTDSQQHAVPVSLS